MRNLALVMLLTVGVSAVSFADQAIDAKPAAHARGLAITDGPPNDPKAPKPEPKIDKPHVDIVFAIDCSGSMGGVIETAKAKIWVIVNQVARAKPEPVLRIGLIGYGNGGRTHRMFNLSADLDEVYKNLSTFKDEGWGDEYVGLAVHKATNELEWSKAKLALKVIYVVGNETAKQGPAEMMYTKTAPLAHKNGIIINAIYCGSIDRAEATPTWKEMANLAGGQYLEIGAQGGAVAIATPFDDELAKLNTQLDGTYVAYGTRGWVGAQDQVAANKLASGKGVSTAASRTVAKSNAQYNNAKWDLVDATKDGKLKLAEVKEEDLPENMQKMTLAERETYIKEQTQKRAEINKKIQAIAVKRDAFIKAEIAKKGLDTSKAFDEKVNSSIKQQAEEAGFKMK